MKRRLVALNLALATLIAGAAWQLRQGWLEGKAREQSVFRQPPEPASTPAAPPVQAPQPVTAATYGEVAQQMLFAKDRNPTVVIEAGPPKPLPPFPVAHGVMNFGDGPMVILSEKPGAAHRGYLPGEQVGEFTLVEANNEAVILEWEGQRFKKRLDELVDRSASEQPGPATEAAREPPPSTPAKTTVASSTAPSGPGAVISGQVRACLPGDTSAPGTVRDGLRKVVSETPFGKVCRWEPVQ